ncbi:hypothetical protein VA7868_01022 [Vibrio aerogenes CECT 7868]|uniref:YchJ-like middle NTF2-like domain-containing protein n=1 Tax=Vibrio aerogenes CECT 7868 TaxID=1216006 RepID=A0A1M5X978_9VIBR|nr:YchJ family metal-binding protein [Vibrio aerogenes]SHH95763.1 hypothetical protein VA7868_01022 [Vibrio aerogenes CECT 7868]
MKKCPCGSKRHYKNCCQPIHMNHSNAETPEQLMRARYTAYAIGVTDFIQQTYHISNEAGQDRQGIEDGILNHWDKLVILDSAPGNSGDEGFVHFKAYFQRNGQSFCLQERSRFIRENGIWFYIDGMISE